MANYDIIGKIVLVKFPREMKLKEKKKFAERFLKTHKQIETVLEKSEKIKGRLRTPQTKFIAGEKTTKTIHKENNCSFKLDVETCYFSPRLSTERKEIALKTKKNEKVLVMFSGVGIFPIVLAKLGKAKEITCVELSRECTKYAKENTKINKIHNVEVLQGDVKRILPKIKSKFDRIVMPRPQLKDSFLEIAFKKIKPLGVIHYYGFYPLSEKNKLKELINNEAKKAKKKIKILKIKKAGEVGVKKFRWRADFKMVS